MSIVCGIPHTFIASRLYLQAMTIWVTHRSSGKMELIVVDLNGMLLNRQSKISNYTI